MAPQFSPAASRTGPDSLVGQLPKRRWWRPHDEVHDRRRGSGGPRSHVADSSIAIYGIADDPYQSGFSGSESCYGCRGGSVARASARPGRSRAAASVRDLVESRWTARRVRNHHWTWTTGPAAQACSRRRAVLATAHGGPWSSNHRGQKCGGQGIAGPISLILPT
jgi:hypothetical protein